MHSDFQAFFISCASFFGFLDLLYAIILLYTTGSQTSIAKLNKKYFISKILKPVPPVIPFDFVFSHIVFNLVFLDTTCIYQLCWMLSITMLQAHEIVVFDINGMYYVTNNSVPKLGFRITSIPRENAVVGLLDCFCFRFLCHFALNQHLCETTHDTM